MNLWIVLALCCFSFSACFEITEDISINADGTGSFRLILNASESKDNLINYMKVGEVDGKKIPAQSEIDYNLVKLKFVLQGIQGLSDVNVEKDFQNFIFKITGNFEQLDRLNLGIIQVAEAFNTSGFDIPRDNNFKSGAGHIQRFFPYPIDTQFYDRARSSVQYILDEARVTSIFRFAEKIKSFTNKKAILSPSGKAVMLKATLAELGKAEKSLENKINY